MSQGVAVKGDTRKNWRGVAVDGYNQHTFYKCMKVSKNKKILLF